MKLTDRTSGILLHLSSLPGAGLCGSLGAPAKAFVDFLHAAKQSWWQMLPINPIDSHFSPYASVSAFAGEPLYLDLHSLVHDRLLDPEDIDWEPAGPEGQVAFQAARDYRKARWRKAFERFRENNGGNTYRAESERFMDENRPWLMQYALFCTLAEHFETSHWSLWPEESLRRADPKALEAVYKEKEERISYHVFLQLIFDVQWRAFRAYCREKGIGLIGDVPIYVGISSVDTWGHPGLFQLDADGRMDRIAGVPGDSFNPDGQRWNSPLYKWDAHKEQGYSWWKSRIRTCLSRFDAVRLDHFIGFYNYFSMPNEPDPNDHGSWIPGPAEDLFDALLEEFPSTAFIAEDLGVLNAGVHALREKYAFPGMNVFQFSFDFRTSEDPTLQWQETSVVCSGTHDTPTLAAWLEEVIADREKPEPFWNLPAILEMLNRFVPETPQSKELFSQLDLPTLCWAVIRMIMHSRGKTAIFPMQDILALGKFARMNFPGHTVDNWLWRMTPNDPLPGLAETLSELTVRYDRSGK